MKENKIIINGHETIRMKDEIAIENERDKNLYMQGYEQALKDINECNYKRVLEINEVLVKENKELKKNYANCKGTPPPEPQLPTKTLCESFSKKRRK